MSTQPKACFGIGCQQHTLCQHFHAIEGTDPADPDQRRPSCDGGRDFLAMGVTPAQVDDVVLRQILWGQG